jgi:ABC-type dipeptide/oligopeptide/nickel transport system permease component
MRNAMLPLTTILVNDFAGLLGGAIITEGVLPGKVWVNCLITH